MKIAFSDFSKAGWTAGGHYLANLLTAVGALGGGQGVGTLLVRPQGAAADRLEELAGQVVRWSAPPPASGGPARVRQALSQRGMLPQPKSPLGRMLRSKGADCLFAAAEYGPRLGLPLIAWIPDFQHLHMPHWFSRAELSARDAAFRAMAQRARLIVVSSGQALGDLQRFHPPAAGKARVLHFVAHPPKAAWEGSPADVCGLYGLPEKFIYLPNQFWAHKNHGLVADALEQICAERPDITVVCTGNTSDSRNPHFFGQLLARISAAGLRERMIMLGLVEHQHVFLLMRQAAAVLQPSLFEGWSTTVEEVKSLGKKMLLSDIPVHREQDPSGGVFFDPEDKNDLARKIVRVFDESEPGPDPAMEQAARRELAGRSREFGERFVSIAREAAA